MIAIAVVASLVVYAWVMGYIGSNTAKSGQALQIQSYAPGADNQARDLFTCRTLGKDQFSLHKAAAYTSTILVFQLMQAKQSRPEAQLHSSQI